MTRSAIPRKIERDVLVEAGHRCAIPTCRQTPVEIAHIEAWAQVHAHEFENLIALCPNCHSRYDKGEIDHKAMRQYKANLSVLNFRYGDLERRILKFFSEPQNTQTNLIKLPGGTQIFVAYLIQDGYLMYLRSSTGHKQDEFPNYDEYLFTAQGRDFIQKWLSGEDLQ
jgi:hypothetical protein